MRILKLLLALGSVAGATSITSAVGGNPNPLLTTGDIWAGTTNGAPTNLPAGASGTFLGSNGIGIAPTYQLINYSSLTGTVPTWNQSTTGSAATLTTPRTIATSGDAVGTATSFNGSANILIPTTVSGINGLAVPASKTIVGTNASSQIVDASAATLSNNTTGSAAKWTTARTFSYTGDATGSMSVDGSANASAALTLASTITAGGPTGGAATVPVITYDAKGRLTAVSTATITPAAIGAQVAGSYQPLENQRLSTTNSPAFANVSTTSSSTGASSPFYAASGFPNLALRNTSASTNEGNWYIGAFANSFVLGGMNDAWGSGANVIYIPRVGTTFTNVQFGAPIVSTLGATIGSGSGTAILTSGVVSPLSGTNLVLGNGTTIAQSTFQAAGSYQPLENQRLSTTNSSTFATVAASGTTNTGAINNGPNFFLYNSSADVGWQVQLGSATTLDFWSRSSGTWGSAPKIKFPLAGFGAGIVQSDATGLFSSSFTVPAATTFSATGTAISAPNGDISSNNNLTTSTTTSASGTVNLADNSAGTQIANASGITYVLPASPSAGRKFVILRRGFGIQITPNGHTVWGPGATSNSSIFTPAASDITELYYNSVGSSWVIIQY
jgi:hypothetical protein